MKYDKMHAITTEDVLNDINAIKADEKQKNEYNYREDAVEYLKSLKNKDKLYITRNSNGKYIVKTFVLLDADSYPINEGDTVFLEDDRYFTIHIRQREDYSGFDVDFLYDGKPKLFSHFCQQNMLEEFRHHRWTKADKSQYMNVVAAIVLFCLFLLSLYLYLCLNAALALFLLVVFGALTTAVFCKLVYLATARQSVAIRKYEKLITKGI